MDVYFAAFSSLLPHFHWSTVSHIRLGRLHRLNCPQGGWVRSPIQKANLFASHLTIVFKPYSSTIAEEITEYLHSPFQMSPPIEPFSSLEIIKLIRRLNPRKASRRDLISNKAIKELLQKGLYSSLLFLIKCH